MLSPKKTLATLACTLAVSTLAWAQPAANERHAEFTVETRQAVLTLLGANMGPLGGILKNEIPYDQALIEKNATRILQLSHMLPDAFVVDTREYDMETDALDKIWDNKDDFNTKAQELANAAENLTTIAASGNEAEVRQAMGAVGKSCGNCHDDYTAD